MNNNDADKMNSEENNSLLRYSEDSSSSHPSTPSESLSGDFTENTSPAQFTTRKERRMSETGLMPQVPNKPVFTDSIPPAAPPTLSTLSAFPMRKQSADKKKAAPVTNAAPVGKTYWGGTVLLTSLLVFLCGQLLWAGLLIGYVVLNPGILRVAQEKLASGNSNAVMELLNQTPWLVVAALFANYISWLSCMWWVTRYRSGLTRDKSIWKELGDSAFWKAFRNNFRLNNFKKRDIAYGAGLAIVLIALQSAIFTFGPEISPEFKAQLEGANNIEVFGSPNTISYYVIGFALGAIASPIIEELFFRGFLLTGFSNHLSYENSGRNIDIIEDEVGKNIFGFKSIMVTYRAFTHKHRNVIALILTTVIFGLMHFQTTSWVTSVYTGFLGLVLGIVALKTNRLYPSIFTHIFHNGFAFAYAAISLAQKHH